MNASNLSQLRPQSRDKNTESEVDTGHVTLACDDSSSGVTERTRNGSGSFKGAEESDEEIVFRGGQSDLPGYERLQSGCGPGSPEEEKIKRKLKFFFLNPVEKYYATRKLPWKLCLQILKVFLVTAQLWIFAGKARLSFFLVRGFTFQWGRNKNTSNENNKQEPA